MPETSLAKGQLIRRGVVDAINIPGFALGSTMTGFAVIAKEAGFDFWMVVATTASVWGLPGQVAFASLYSNHLNAAHWRAPFIRVIPANSAPIENTTDTATYTAAAPTCPRS